MIRIIIKYGLLSLLVILTAPGAQARKLRDSDTPRFCYGSSSCVTYQEWKTFELKGQTAEDLLQLFSENPNVLSSDYLKLLQILEKEREPLKFDVDTYLFERRIKVKFTLSLKSRKDRKLIVVSNLRLFERVGANWNRKAFFYFSGDREHLISRVDRHVCNLRSDLLYPVFETEENDGKLQVPGDTRHVSEPDTVYLDMFKLALGLYNRKSNY